MSRDPAHALTQFFGGRICLDFANTMDWRTSDEPQELIPDYPTLLTWSRARQTLPLAALDKLQARAATEPGVAAAALREAHSLRAEIWRIAEALCRRERVPLPTLNRLLQQMPAQPELISETDRYVHDLRGGTLDEALRPVIWSLTALLTSDDATRVGVCSARDCGWFFVDESPNHTRLWCSSEVCGNRERARRAYARRTASGKVRPPRR